MLNINTKGNKKLKNNENIRFMIWNLPAQKTCPFATEHCKKYRYAKKAERIYKNVLPSRERNFIESTKKGFVFEMITTIETLLNRKAYKDKKVYFRIHESGDFYSQEYFDKWLDIAEYFEGRKNITFLAYTKSVKFVHDLKSNFIVRFSIWDDTLIKNLNMASEKGLPTYSAKNLTTENIKNLGLSFCPCDDCGNCGRCYTQDIKHIYCNIH